MKNFTFITVLFFSSLLFSTMAGARTFVGEGIFEKQQKKESTRWTLADWLTQKKQFRAMDHWLALNRSRDLFEISIHGSTSEYDLTVNGSEEDGKKKVDSGSISLYWSIFGLQYDYASSDEDWTRESARLNIRIFGASSQTTNLSLHYGARRWKMDGPPENQIDNQFAGAKLNLYITGFFGLEGEYSQYFKDTAKNGDEYESTSIEYGAFIDVYFVRVYGSAFKETVEISSGGTPTEDTREGAKAGVKFYF